MNKINYEKDEFLNLYIRKRYEGIPYSDGNEIEKHILSIIESASDLSIYSNELSNSINNWPTEYHFSRQRHVIIQPCNIKPDETVLELGCGCGAITRYLGELGAEVTAIEGSIIRATAAANRCKDLSNVTVICDNIDNFITNEKYDWVLLIGVLEYAPIFIMEGSSVESYLKKIGNFLSKKGQLVIAIENKLGLKYFNGCNEDHVNKIFYGLQGLYKNKGPVTFGKVELKTLLSESDFKNIDFLYPFPDYKLPYIIVTEKGMLDDNFNVANILSSTFSRDYSGQSYRLFNEALVYQELSKNNILMDLSNSFLVIASKNEDTKISTDLLGIKYSSQRIEKFSTNTRFIKQGDNIICEKVRNFVDLSPTEEIDNFYLDQVDTEQRYFQGPPLSSVIARNISISSNNDDIVNSIIPWVDYLISNSSNCCKSNELESYFIYGRYLDLIPSNIIDNKNGYKIIDQEWQVNQDIPLGWLLLRGIITVLSNAIVFEDLKILYGDVLTDLCAKKGLLVQDISIRKWWELEKKLQKAVTGITIKNDFNEFVLIGKPKFEKLLLLQSQNFDELKKEVDYLNNQVAILMEEKELILSSKSWKLTKPLRLLKSLIT